MARLVVLLPLVVGALARASGSDAGVTALPPVDVPLPAVAEAPLPSSPLVRDPTASLTVIETAAHRGEAVDAAALLSTAPGVVLQDAGGAGQRQTLSLRGAAPNAVLVLLDGVPLAGPGAAVDLSRIPVATLARLEVLRGGASARYGPGGMGGAVNLVTRAPDGATRVFGEVSHGSFVTTRASVGAAGAVPGGEGLLLLHGLRSEGTFDFRYDALPAVEANAPEVLRRENNGALQGGGLLRYRARRGDTTVDVLAEGVAEARGLAGPVQNPSVGARQETARGTLSLRTRTALAAGGELSVLGFGRLDGTRLEGGFFGSGPFQQVESAAGLEATWTQLLLGRHGVTALLAAGADALREPSGANPLQGRVGALLGDEWLLLEGRAALNGSVRVDVAGPFVVASPKLGAWAQLPFGVELKANVGQASRPPSFSELYVVQGTLLPNAALRPERALTADAAVAVRHAKGRLEVTGFVSRYEDLIAWEYYPPNLARPYNFQAAQAGGVEVEGEATPWPWLTVGAAYTFLGTQNLQADPRYALKALPFRPAHRLHARVAGGPRWLQAHAEVVYQSQQAQNRTGTLVLPERAFVNLGVRATPWERPEVTLALELKNLLDVQSQDVDGYPLPPRALFATVALAWEAGPR